MEAWEQRLIKEMYNVVDRLSSSLSKKEEDEICKSLDDLVILGELTLYLTKKMRDDQAMEIDSKLEETIQEVIRLWEEEKGMSSSGLFENRSKSERIH
ncbi:hypothetical protein C815_02207 [Firmicutes bacterium M10-2]|nr:hypothetical protein C815_02207 [Firmicutes bacterium M10-2]